MGGHFYFSDEPLKGVDCHVECEYIDVVYKSLNKGDLKMVDHPLDVKTTDNLPSSVNADAKKRIHEKLKGLVEQELSKESQTLGASPAKPAIHGSIEWKSAFQQAEKAEHVERAEQVKRVEPTKS